MGVELASSIAAAVASAGPSGRAWMWDALRASAHPGMAQPVVMTIPATPSNPTSYSGELATWFAAHADDSAYNAFLDRPAVLALVGDPSGQQILDVGSGAGHYAEALTAAGATVHSIEGSSELIAHAQRRLGDRAQFTRHDLEQPLDFVADDSVDGVLIALTVHHIAARGQLYAELFRVVRPGGWLVLSTDHPGADWADAGGDYFAVEQVDLRFGGGRFSSLAWRMPLTVLLAEAQAPGFALDRVVEPRPVPALRDLDADLYEHMSTHPTFIAIRLTKPAG